jgi:hypothetical protein
MTTAFVNVPWCSVPSASGTMYFWPYYQPRRLISKSKLWGLAVKGGGNLAVLLHRCSQGVNVRMRESRMMGSSRTRKAGIHFEFGNLKPLEERSAFGVGAVQVVDVWTIGDDQVGRRQWAPVHVSPFKTT